MDLSNRRWVRVISAVLLFVALPLRASDLIEIRTPHFTVISALSEKETRKLLDEMRVFQTVVTMFTTVKDVRPQVPLRIYLMRSSDWNEHLRPGKLASGVMSGRPLSFVAAMDAQGWSQTSRILYHEFVHFVMRNADQQDYPAWFEEGLAEMLSTVRVQNGKVRIGEVTAERFVDLNVPGGSSRIPLQQLLTTRPAINDDGKHSVALGFYAQASALMHYIAFEHPNGSKALAAYLTAQANGQPSDVAFEKSFGMTLAEMDELLRRYTRRDSYRMVTADVSTLPVPEAGPYVVRQLGDLEAALELGGLMMRLGTNPEKVPAYYERVLKRHAGNAKVMAGKANALALLNQFDKADPVLSKALEVAPDDRDVLVLAGDIESIRLYRTGPDGKPVPPGPERTAIEQKMFDYYHRALAEPYAGLEALETVVHYARLALDLDPNPHRALMQIEHVRRSYPTEPTTAALHALVLTKLDRASETRDEWEVAARYGSGKLREDALRALAAMSNSGS